MTRPELSIIVPLYNEELNVQPLYRAVIDAAEALGRPFELVLVDDGSRDRTFETAKEIALRDRRVRVIKFRRNFGQTPAMVAGIQNARGRVLVTMDGDLQNDPADIGAFLAKMDEGYDIVVGWRRRRQDKFVTRILPSRIANWLIGRVTGVAIKDNGCSLKAFRAELVKNIPLYSEMHRFIPATASVSGARLAQIPVRHHPRRFGQSKYGLSRIYKVLIDLVAIKTVMILTSRPLFAFTGMALGAALLSMALLTYEIVVLIFDQQGSSTVILGLGLQFAVLALFLVSLGLLAQLVYKTGDLKVSDLSALTARVVEGPLGKAADGTP